MTTQVFQVVQSNVVVNAIVADNAVTLSGGALALPGGGFLAPPVGQIIMQQSGAGPGWTLSGGVLSPPAPPTLSFTSDQLKIYANKRAAALSKGGHNVVVAGSGTYLFPTDGYSINQMNFTATRLLMTGAPSSVVWPTGSGFITFTSDQLLNAAAAVVDYMQSIQTTLSATLTSIAGNSVTTKAQIDGASWPTP